MSASDVDVVVIGAGMAGLAAGHDLRASGRDVLVLDANDRPGGVAQSERVGDYLLERGPNTMAVRAPVLALLRRLGLEAELAAAAPAAKLRFLVHEGRLEPLPTGLVAAARTPLLSAGGKLRLLREPFVRRGDGNAETVDEFCSRRLGAEASERLVGAFLTGVYAGDERELGAAAVFPSLVRFERERGSIVRGALAGMRDKGAERGLRGIHSGVEGMGGLAGAMARGLGERIQLGVRVSGLARENGAWRLALAAADGERELRARSLVLAVPAAEAAALLGEIDPELAKEIGEIRYAPIVSLSLGLDPADAAVPIRGFGFLVPRREGMRVLGCLYPSQLFPGRAPAGRELLTVLLGGVRWPEAVEQGDDALCEAVQRDLERTLGLRGAPQLLAVTRWPRAVAQPDRHHPQRIASIQRRAAELSPLALAGAWLSGVGVPDTITSALNLRA